MTKLPEAEGTRLFKMDASSMYTNIDTDHGVNILNSFQKCTEMNCQLASLLLA